MNTQKSEQVRTVTGVVQQLVYSRILLRLTSGQIVDVDTAQAVLYRKNGLPMVFTDIAVGNRVQVGGQVWSDGSMTAHKVRNLSLYPHAGTFAGKVVAVDVAGRMCTIRSALYGEQRILFTADTALTVKGRESVLGVVEVGMSAVVRGVWEQTRAQVIARSVRITYRLLNIDITGEVVSQVESDCTVVVGTAIYAVHTAGTVFRGLAEGVTAAQLVGRMVRAVGKHIAESLSVTAVRVTVLSARL